MTILCRVYVSLYFSAIDFSFYWSCCEAAFFFYLLDFTSYFLWDHEKDIYIYLLFIGKGKKSHQKSDLFVWGCVLCRKYRKFVFILQNCSLKLFLSPSPFHSTFLPRPPSFSSFTCFILTNSSPLLLLLLPSTICTEHHATFSHLTAVRRLFHQLSLCIYTLRSHTHTQHNTTACLTTHRDSRAFVSGVCVCEHTVDCVTL